MGGGRKEEGDAVKEKKTPEKDQDEDEVRNEGWKFWHWWKNHGPGADFERPRHRGINEAEEPHISAKEPHISAKEPHISVKEPHISAKEPDARVATAWRAASEPGPQVCKKNAGQFYCHTDHMCVISCAGCTALHYGRLPLFHSPPIQLPFVCALSPFSPLPLPSSLFLTVHCAEIRCVCVYIYVYLYICIYMYI